MASWTIGDLSQVTLRGRIRGAGDDALRTRHVRDWAARLGEPERWKPYRNGLRGELAVDAVYAGVETQVWTPLAAAPNRAGEDRAPIAESENGPAAERVRRSQKLAALALAEVLSADSVGTAVAWWYIAAREDIELEGHIRDIGGDRDDRVQLIAAWGHLLETVPQWKAWPNPQGGELSVTGTISEIPVEVWTWLPAAPAQVKR